MAKRTPLVFTQADLEALQQERFEHPHPRVQQRLWVLWLISQGLTQALSGRLAGVARATVKRYVATWRAGGLPALRECHWDGPVSELVEHQDTLAESFRQTPPHTVAEACARIQTETGLERRPTQVRAFLKKCWA
jgi:transposase